MPNTKKIPVSRPSPLEPIPAVTAANVLLGPGITLGKNISVMPNSLARSMLFSSVPSNVKRRQYTEETLIASWPDVDLYQRAGIQMSQSEASVWMELLRMTMACAAPGPTDQRKVKVQFTASELLRALGRDTGGSDKKDLLKTISRLGKALLRVKIGGSVRFTGKLLSFASDQPSADHRYEVQMNMALASLFAGGWAFIDLRQRQALKGNPLAQWLHAHYSTHSKKPLRIGHRKLQELCGRAKMREKIWLKGLQSALSLMQLVTTWTCVLDKFGNVNVNKLGGGESAPLSIHKVNELSDADDTLLKDWLEARSSAGLRGHLERLGVKPSLFFHRGEDAAPKLRQMLRTTLVQGFAGRPKLERLLSRLRKKAAATPA